MNTEKIINGGVKHVTVKETGDPDFLTVAIVDEEGLGDTLARFMMRKDHTRPVPTQVEEYLFDRYLMGPTWFWAAQSFGEWEGQFAHLTNPKCSDGFSWRVNHI